MVQRAVHPGVTIIVPADTGKPWQLRLSGRPKASRNPPLAARLRPVSLRFTKAAQTPGPAGSGAAPSLAVPSLLRLRRPHARGEGPGPVACHRAAAGSCRVPLFGHSACRLDDLKLLGQVCYYRDYYRVTRTTGRHQLEDHDTQSRLSEPGSSGLESESESAGIGLTRLAGGDWGYR